MRKELQEELNRVNELYQQYDLDLRKSGGSDMQRQQMRDMMNRKKEQLVSEMGDDLQKLNIGKSKTVSGGTLTRNLKDMGEGLDATTIPKIGKGQKAAFAQTKAKMMPGVSGLGVGADLLQGDYEKAADNVAGDFLQNAPSMIAKGIGKIAPKAAGMALKAANPLGLLIGEAIGSEKVGEGSDMALNEAQDRDVELVRGVSKDDDTMNTAKMKALQRMLGN